MPIRVHVISYRNGPQVMVAGLRLRDMGYCRGAQVEVTDPTGNPTNMSWKFIVSNDEHATLVCSNPPPPGWIQPNVRIQIEVRSHLARGEGAVARRAASSPGDLDSARPGLPRLELALPEPGPGLPPRVIYAVDVGAPRGGLAWARLAPHAGRIPAGSTDYDLFLEQLVRDLRAGLSVALGFEAPLFLPVASTIGELTRRRHQEPGPWSFGPGAYVTTVVIPLMALTLKHLRSTVSPSPDVSLDPARWLAPNARGASLLLWEAYVWGTGHAREPNASGLPADVQDAATAVRAFAAWEAGEPRQLSSITANDPISTVGAALLWSGLESNLELLHQQALVLRPMHPMGNDVVRYDQSATVPAESLHE